MVGTDWPVCTLAGAYADVMRPALAAAAELSDEQEAAVLGGNALRFYCLR